MSLGRHGACASARSVRAIRLNRIVPGEICHIGISAARSPRAVAATVGWPLIPDRTLARRWAAGAPGVLRSHGSRPVPQAVALVPVWVTDTPRVALREVPLADGHVHRRTGRVRLATSRAREREGVRLEQRNCLTLVIVVCVVALAALIALGLVLHRSAGLLKANDPPRDPSHDSSDSSRADGQREADGAGASLAESAEPAQAAGTPAQPAAAPRPGRRRRRDRRRGGRAARRAAAGPGRERRGGDRGQGRGVRGPGRGGPPRGRDRDQDGQGRGPAAARRPGAPRGPPGRAGAADATRRPARPTSGPTSLDEVQRDLDRQRAGPPAARRRAPGGPGAGRRPDRRPGQGPSWSRASRTRPSARPR